MGRFSSCLVFRSNYDEGRTSWHHKSLGPAPWEGILVADVYIPGRLEWFTRAKGRRGGSGLGAQIGGGRLFWAGCGYIPVATSLAWKGMPRGPCVTDILMEIFCESFCSAYNRACSLS